MTFNFEKRFGKVDDQLDALQKKQQENHDTLITISLNIAQLVKTVAPAG